MGVTFPKKDKGRPADENLNLDWDLVSPISHACAIRGGLQGNRLQKVLYLFIVSFNYYYM